MSTLDAERYDAVIIGAGMSGLAAGIRLAMYDRRVLILEKHNAPGGLNSFYNRGGRRFDVGLHAMTNYVPPGVKGTPLVKLLRQLRLPREAFALCEQCGSRIHFPGVELVFTNDFTRLESEVAIHFPREIDGFRRLVAMLRAYDDTAIDAPSLSARAVIGEYVHDPLLVDMLLLPLMYYGSASEHDMDWAQCVIMFKALYCEGFARPYEGVRRVIRELTKKYKSLGGERRMGLGVKRIVASGDAVSALELDDGSVIYAEHVLSSVGLVETARLCEPSAPEASGEAAGKLAYVETMQVLDCQPRDLGWEDTIVFFSREERAQYACPKEPVDVNSGVICFPNNYLYEAGAELDEGWYRVTALADYRYWSALDGTAYEEAKEQWFARLCASAQACLPAVKEAELARHVVARDMFTPRTVERFTGHVGGAIYGSPKKRRDGRTHLKNLYIIGTDQGFLGIVGAMLSGISMANYHVLKG